MTDKQKQVVKGRPHANQYKNMQVIHQPRQQKPQIVKEYWTQHRITLIAYEAQFVRNRKKQQEESQVKEKQQSTEKPKKTRKKIDLKYQSGFLFADQNQKQQIKVQQRFSKYPYLQQLAKTTNEQMCEVRQMVKIMLQLKSPKIIEQFLDIYNLIVHYISDVSFQRVVKEKDRNQWMEQHTKRLVTHIRQNIDNFTYFQQYLRQDGFDTQKLLKVQIYCFLAEKFNFNINQYYSDAFSITLEGKGKSKKVKPNEDKAK